MAELLGPPLGADRGIPDEPNQAFSQMSTFIADKCGGLRQIVLEGSVNSDVAGAKVGPFDVTLADDGLIAERTLPDGESEIFNVYERAHSSGVEYTGPWTPIEIDGFPPSRQKNHIHVVLLGEMCDVNHIRHIHSLGRYGNSGYSSIKTEHRQASIFAGDVQPEATSNLIADTVRDLAGFIGSFQAHMTAGIQPRTHGR